VTNNQRFANHPFGPFNQPTTKPAPVPSRLPCWERSTRVLPTSLCRTRPATPYG